MAYTQADIDKLKTAIVSGERVVQFENRRVEYRSIAELTEALAAAEDEVNVAAGKTRTRLIRVSTRRGF